MRTCRVCGVRKELDSINYEYARKDIGTFRRKCKSCMKGYRKEYYKKYNEKNNSYVKQRNNSYNKKTYNLLTNEDKKERNAYSNKVYHGNIAHYREYNRLRYEKDSEHYIIKVNERRQKMLGLPYTLSKEDWKKTLETFNYSCAYCGSLEKIQQDHVIPLAKSGYYNAQNVIPACRSCNSSKCDSDLDTWYKNKDYYEEESYLKIIKFIGMDKKSKLQQLGLF